MKLAISNIAWQPDESDAVYELLQAYGFEGLEFAPGLLFPEEDDAFVPRTGAVNATLQRLASFGLRPVSMQSLHFGVQGAALFGTDTERTVFTNSINRAINLAGRLEFSNLVIGSPRNRVIPGDMDTQQADEIALSEFRLLADSAFKTGQKLAIEPNPAAYGANFLTRMSDVCDFVSRCDHPAITINFDTGALHMNEDMGALEKLYDLARQKISHIHLSEAWLAPVPSGMDWLVSFSDIVKARNYDGWVSIEMKRSEKDPLASIEQSLDAVSRAFS